MKQTAMILQHNFAHVDGIWHFTPRCMVWLCATPHRWRMSVPLRTLFGLSTNLYGSRVVLCARIKWARMKRQQTIDETREKARTHTFSFDHMTFWHKQGK